MPCLVFTPSKGIIHLSMDVIWRGGHKGSFYTTTSIPRNFANISRELLRSEITTISPLRHTVTKPTICVQKNQYSKSSIIFRSFIAWKIRQIDFWNKSDILRDLPHCATRTVASSEKFKSTQSLPGSLPSGFVSQKLPCSQTVTTLQLNQ